MSHRLKVGVDFGTTFSGVAWNFTGAQEDVIIIREWPGHRWLQALRSSDKVPSEIVYDSLGEVSKWGFQIKTGEERLAWIKLLLEPTKYISNNRTINSTRSLIFDQNTKEPVDVVADYLTCLRKHAIHCIQNTYGKAFVDATPIDYILTVPAIWSDNAKELTLQAAETAGFGDRTTLQLVSEPDAAAAWTLLRDLKSNFLQINDAFVIVDCGGGTVDLISYQVTETSPNITVKECAAGTGGLCGSTFLNGNFENMVRSRLGRRFEALSPRKRNDIMKKFEEELKRNFTDSDDDDEIYCPVGGIPDDPIAGIDGGDLIITREEMKEIFDPVIDKIIPLVENQVRNVEAKSSQGLRLTSILLVGGFGSSKYLLKRIEKEVRRADMSPIEIIQPANAWSAVARGAAIGLRISTRTSRRHYGTVCDVPFIHGKHPVGNLYKCPFTGIMYCANTMAWFINEGNEVSEEKPISLRFFHTARTDMPMMFTTELYAAEMGPAPSYLNSPINPARILCHLESDLSMLPTSEFTKRMGLDSQEYYEINLEFVLTMKSAMILTFEQMFKGKRYGCVTAKYSLV
ncbi:actin-like ATPase domain-containing protein [Morchella conica CCBAS932]|uniref:Actin-like ATPase domain-containing protein n=1 Tax=Morchella conica CCBAS932 TaxID=1392247 RepID=A0A3N4KXD6_9PEZI|nr:actin-like ATPase domain-containing protein [Morchella conica CCBAS932]